MWVKVSLSRLDHQFGHPAIVTWVEADPPATVEVVGGGDDRRANGDRLPHARILGSDSHPLGERNASCSSTGG